MTDNRLVLRLLSEVLDAQPTTAPDRLLASVLADVRNAPQRGRRPLMTHLEDLVADPYRRRLAVGGLLVAAAAAFAFIQLVPRAGLAGPGATASPSPAASAPTNAPSASPSPSPSVAASGSPVAVEDIGDRGLIPDATYTSNRFRPRVTFKLPPRGDWPEGGRTDWCSPLGSDAPVPYTSAGTIRLQYTPSCISDLRIIHPYAIDCGTADAHPDAAAFASAILARRIAGARDLGTLQSAGVVPGNLLAGVYQGRVIRIDGSGRTIDSATDDPDHCRILPAPNDQDPTIEIRGDLAALLVLIDVRGELVVLRVAPSGGYDGRTSADARGRDSIPGLMESMLGRIHDLDLAGPTTPTLSSVSPNPSVATSPSAAATAVALEDLGSNGHLVTGLTYTSDRFQPRVTFRLATRDAVTTTSGQETDWCSPVNMEAPMQTSAGAIVLRHPKSCTDRLMLLHPDAVDCGTPDAHPDAATLATAILARLGGTAARDLGTLQSVGAAPKDLFAGATNGRVIQVTGQGGIPSGRCRLLAEPGSGDPALEIRGDVTARLILVDVRGTLVVVRVDAGLEDHLLQRIYDISFD
jgi:hypothetical protein